MQNERKRVGWTNVFKRTFKFAFYGEISLGSKYVCKICGEKLVTEKSESTGGVWIKNE